MVNQGQISPYKNMMVIIYKRTRRRSDSVLWQKPIYQQKIRKPIDNTKTPPKNFDYTTIADRLKTVSCSNNSNPNDLVKPVYVYPTFPLTAKAV